MKPFYERYEEFVGIEIQNVEIVVDTDYEIHYEAGACDPHIFGVYMILIDGTVEQVGDFPTRKNARHYADMIKFTSDKNFEIYDKTFGDGE